MARWFTEYICLTMVWAGWASWACGGVGLLVTCTPSHISQHFISAPAGINQIQPQCSDTKFPSYIGSFLCFLLILLSTFLRQTKTEGWRLLRTSGDDICWGAVAWFALRWNRCERSLSSPVSRAGWLVQENAVQSREGECPWSRRPTLSSITACRRRY